MTKPLIRLKNVLTDLAIAGNCALINDQVRKMSDGGKALSIRRATITRMINRGYIVIDRGLIIITPAGVAILPTEPQMKVMDVDAPLEAALRLLTRKDRAQWILDHWQPK